MSFPVLFFARHEVRPLTGIPPAAAIEAALRRVLTMSNNPQQAALLGRGDWVGLPRIVRHATLSPGTDGWRRTYVTWLYVFPDPPASIPAQSMQQYNEQRKDALLHDADVQLGIMSRDGGFSPWAELSILPYDPVSNGSMDWWRRGTDNGAAATRTRDQFDLNQQWGETARENPTGPTTLTPDPIRLPSALSGTGKTLVTLGVLAVIGMGLYYFGPAIRGIGKRASRPRLIEPTRKNPTHRRRHRALARTFG